MRLQSFSQKKTIGMTEIFEAWAPPGIMEIFLSAII